MHTTSTTSAGPATSAGRADHAPGGHAGRTPHGRPCVSLACALALAIAAVVVPAPGPLAAAPAHAAMHHAGGWGGEGTARGKFGTGRERVGGNRQFNSPGGIAVDRHGRLYVADPSNNRVQIFTTSGRYLRSFGRYGFDPGASSVAARGQFILPQGLALDAAGNVFIADNRNDRVVKHSAGGRFRARLGRRGSIGSEMVSPWGVAVHGKRVYVVDQGNSRVQIFTTRGHAVRRFGHFGTKRGRFRAPYGIAVDAHGIVYVSMAGRDQIDRFTSRGRFLGSWGHRGSGPGEFDQPAGLAFDPQGNLLVADCANQRIQRLSPKGRFLESFGLGALRDPTFVAAGRDGAVYVSDYRRVERFVPSAKPDPQHRPAKKPGRLACVSQAQGASTP